MNRENFLKELDESLFSAESKSVVDVNAKVAELIDELKSKKSVIVPLELIDDFASEAYKLPYAVCGGAIIEDPKTGDIVSQVIYID